MRTIVLSLLFTAAATLAQAQSADMTTSRPAR